ncbi:GntR family transcriptional regulator [Lancefieldella rimae]|uniref:GntR family transcriptional regulator n=1 Tax=Lancefieldella rimae TaxID=1383 RepID=UPI001CAB37C5|nr:GntR family transcriptional regulator [Lancefieldella rimae]MBF4804717.1 GntR family transcriptional regulator [Lancefieldella rimae]
MSRKKIPPLDNALESVKNYIMVNHLKEGDRLPSERDMCEMWEISRSALRSAVRYLTTMHVLESRQGSGTYMAPERPISVTGTVETYGFSDNVRKSGHTPNSMVISQKICSGNAHVARKLTIDRSCNVLQLMRLRYVDGLPCMIETSYVNEALCPGIESHDFSKESLFDVMRNEYGFSLTHGTDTLSITHLDSQEADLLDMYEGDAVFFQSGINFGRDKEPLEYYKSVIRPDRYTFVSLCGRPMSLERTFW